LPAADPSRFMNLEYARSQMLRQQIRAWEVLDDQVLGIMGRIPREAFVPEAFRELAFADLEIPLGNGQQMMTPKIEGRLLQSLRLLPVDRVLEIGTGSGFLTACLANLAETVVSVEVFPEFTDSARAKLESLGTSNVELSTADALRLEYADEFDAIALTASLPELDEYFIRMLRPGGRLFAVVGREPIMEARLITRHANGEWTQQSLFETVIKSLLNIEVREPFAL
jgi:protein-L-isoaspartate(D-aspartate) O-methyltransferase